MKIDFNSLVVLNAVLECKSVTIAARQLSTSPSSVTYAINKLRKITVNPIFTRSKTGVKPTTLAIELNERYKKAVSLICDGLDSGDSRPGSEMAKTITISTYTFLELWLSLAAFRKGSVGENQVLNFASHPITSEERLAKLRNREVDIDIGAQLPNDSSVISVKLYNSNYKVMVSNKHSSIKNELTQQDWMENNHITWSRVKEETFTLTGDSISMDEFKNRKVGVMSYSSLNMLVLCAESDYLMLIPEYFDEFVCNTLPVKTFDIPFETNMESTLYLHYHIAATSDTAVEKCIQMLRELSF
ncbi:LysR family transcriptional regulator [Rahnella laticis]|uniref:LysR family transcriptional regulator n=1 Tax=Rahnella laticis TaxID=2787622 RepID=UPI0018A2B4A3|nr:LysR family transcriptional regulator [Rahnella laticis]MBF7993692.1 LysR family transcriptional regulator [Rahnella laticis]